MKNKITFVGFILYMVSFAIFLFVNTYITNINIYLASLISSNTDKITTIAEIIYEIECGLFYLGMGIFITIMTIEKNDTIKYIIIFSILFSLLVCVVAFIVKSYVSNISLINCIVIILSSLVGVMIELLIKIKQVRSE